MFLRLYSRFATFLISPADMVCHPFDLKAINIFEYHFPLHDLGTAGPRNALLSNLHDLQKLTAIKKYHVFTASSSNRSIFWFQERSFASFVIWDFLKIPYYKKVNPFSILLPSFLPRKYSFLWALWSLSSCTGFLWRMVPARPITVKITFWHISYIFLVLTFVVRVVSVLQREICSLVFPSMSLMIKVHVYVEQLVKKNPHVFIHSLASKSGMHGVTKEHHKDEYIKVNVHHNSHT